MHASATAICATSTRLCPPRICPPLPVNIDFACTRTHTVTRTLPSTPTHGFLNQHIYDTPTRDNAITEMRACSCNREVVVPGNGIAHVGWNSVPPAYAVLHRAKLGAHPPQCWIRRPHLPTPAIGRRPTSAHTPSVPLRHCG